MDLTFEKGIEELRKPIIHEFGGNEKAFEEMVVLNMDQICQHLNLPPIKAIQTQRRIKCDNFTIKPDILVKHIDGTTTVFEVKKPSEKYPLTGTSNQMNAIGQLLLYQTVLQAVSHSTVRMALIDNKIYYRTYCAFMNHKLPITLMEIQKDRLFVPYNGWNQ